MTKQTEFNRRWMKKQEDKGLCIFCCQPSLKHSKRCEKHFMSQVARTHGIKDWTIVRDLFYEQGEKCYLTGRHLELGLNASLDHINPRCKIRPSMPNPHNLLWCDLSVNLSKSGISLDEFVSICKDVSKNFPYDEN